MLRHRLPRGQENPVSLDNFDRAIKRRLNFENRPSSFGRRTGVLKSPSPTHPSQLRCGNWELALSGAG